MLDFAVVFAVDFDGVVFFVLALSFLLEICSEGFFKLLNFSDNFFDFAFSSLVLPVALESCSLERLEGFLEEALDFLVLETTTCPLLPTTITSLSLSFFDDLPLAEESELLDVLLFSLFSEIFSVVLFSEIFSVVLAVDDFFVNEVEGFFVSDELLLVPEIGLDVASDFGFEISLGVDFFSLDCEGSSGVFFFSLDFEVWWDFEEPLSFVESFLLDDLEDLLLAFKEGSDRALDEILSFRFFSSFFTVSLSFDPVVRT